MGGFSLLESGGKQFAVIMGVGNSTDDVTANPLRPAYPEALAAENVPAYSIVEGNSSNEEALAGMDALHRLYAAEKGTLIAAAAGREEARKAAALERKRNPPQPPDMTIQIWRKENPEENPEEVGGAE